MCQIQNAVLDSSVAPHSTGVCVLPGAVGVQGVEYSVLDGRVVDC